MRTRPISLALALLLAAPPLVVSQVTLEGLGDLPGAGFDSRARGVSGDGSVVVGQGHSTLSGSHSEGALWEGGIIYQLGDLPGAEFTSTARAVSADGAWIVGSSRARNAGWRYGHWRACVWNPAGILAELPGITGVGEKATHAFGVSGDGSVIVGWSDGAASDSSRRVAVRWFAGSADELGWLPGLDRTEAFDVSDDGQVIVGTASNGGPNEGFRWTPSTGMQSLGAGTDAEAVSPDGTYIVGQYAGKAGRWSAAEGWISTNFGFRPLGVSTDGQVVVGYTAYAGGGGAILWTPAGGARYLLDVVEGEWGHDTGGWTFGEAWDVSPDGTVIVGRGTNPSGQKEAFKLTLPRETWSHEGQALAGTKGDPTLRGTGAMLVNLPVRLELNNVRNSAPALLVIGLGRVDAPFAGGTLVPFPHAIVTGLATGQQGKLVLSSPWVSGVPAGQDLFFQYWILDSVGPAGMSASNALAVTVR